MIFPQLGPQYYRFYDIISLYSQTKDINMHEMIGKRFGKWIVLEFIGRDSKSEQLYKCQCDCGTIKSHKLSTLKANSSVQCRSCHIRNLNKIEDLIKKQFGYWKVIGKIKDEKRNEWLFKCECKCGLIKNISGHHLKSGSTTKCHRCRNKTHGMSYTDTFRIWTGILRRCLNPNFKNYKNYGGRGIKVCESWLKFENFFQDMGNRPVTLQIDRIDNDGNYEPGNCRWVTAKENSLNKKRKST